LTLKKKKKKEKTRKKNRKKEKKSFHKKKKKCSAYSFERIKEESFFPSLNTKSKVIYPTPKVPRCYFGI
jgi:ribosomal protein L37E